jgi:hypothetical protein
LNLKQPKKWLDNIGADRDEGKHGHTAEKD